MFQEGKNSSTRLPYPYLVCTYILSFCIINYCRIHNIIILSLEILSLLFNEPQEPLGAYSQLDLTEKPEMMNLTERHILDFARQIAAGMVSYR